jgi:beta-glucosidase
VQVIRAQAKTPPLIGFAPVGSTCVPATDSPADIAAARMAMFSTTSRTLWSNTWFSDPIFKKQYPSDALTVFGEDAPVVGPQDMEIISQPLDFYGCNIYSAMIIRAGADGTPEIVTPRVGHEINTYGWYVIPECLYWGPRFFYERYQQPIIITENGMPNLDWVARDGKVHDPQRIDYLARHLLAFERAGADGVDIRGYFQWSIMDNFEWQEGYKQRFGLVYVDYATQRRIPKASAYWYRDVIVSNGASLHM